MKWMNRITSGQGLAVFALAASFVATTGFAQTSASAYTTGYRYTTGGLLAAVIRPYSGTGTVSYLATRYTYNSAGLPSTVEAGALAAWQSQNVDPATWPNFAIFQTEAYSYDSMGRVLTKKLSSGGVAFTLLQYSYDIVGRRQCAATRMNPAQFSSLPDACTLSTEGSYGPDRITYTTYNAQNRPLTIQRGYGTAVQQLYATYTYTPNGLTQTIKDANGNLTTQSYDGLDRLSKSQFPSKTTAGTSSTTDLEQYTYDANNNRKTLVTRDSQTISYSYDALDRMTLKQWPASWAVSVYYGYDLRNLRLFANYSSATGPGVSNTYDGFGHMSSETMNLSGAAQQMAYQYDADGNRAKVTFPDGNYISYSYDGLDRLTQALENGGSTLAVASYDVHGRIQQLARGGGVTTTGFGYDDISRLTTLSHTLATAADNGSFSFGDNPANQIITQGVSNGEYTELPTSTTQSYTVNGLNQYSAVAGVSFSSDIRGNLTSDGSTTYTYDLENHLTAASGTYNASLSYDPLGRVYQTIAGSVTTAFVYDENRIALEYNGSGTLLRRYAFGSGGDNPLVWYEGAAVGQSNRRYLHSDHEGSIIAVTDGNGGTFAVNRYDAYGIRGPSNQGRFQYTGQAYIPELGLYYYKARMYNASLGRFMQTDPVGFVDDYNLYSYVGNDPLDKTDPSGNWAVFDDLIALGVGAVLGVGAQGVEDFMSGHLSSLGEYAASGAGGAVAGEVALYAVPTIGPAGLPVAAAAGSATTDVLKAVVTGKSLDAKEVAINAGIAAATVGVPGLKSEAGTVAKALLTKAERGTISSATNKTMAKAVVGKAADEAGGAATAGAVAGVKDRVNEAPATRQPAQSFTCGTPGTVSCGK